MKVIILILILSTVAYSFKVKERNAKIIMEGDRPFIYKFDLKPFNGRNLNISLIESSNKEINLEIIRHNKMIYVLAPAYSANKFNLTLNYKIGGKQWKETKTLELKNQITQGMNRLEFKVDQMNIEEFLEIENRILNYFVEKLNNKNARISAISYQNDSLKIELMNNQTFSEEAQKWSHSFCKTHFIELEQKNETGVQQLSLFGDSKYRLRRCDIRLFKLDPNSLKIPDEAMINISITSHSISHLIDSSGHLLLFIYLMKILISLF